MTKKLNIEDLKKLKESARTETALRAGDRRIKVTVHMGTCGIAAGAREVMNTLMNEIEDANITDIVVTTSGCMGLCSKEPLITVEVLGKEAIIYEHMNENKMRQIFKRHIIGDEVQIPFALARGTDTAT